MMAKHMQEDDLDVVGLLSTFRRRWYLITIGAGIGFVGAWLFNTFSKPIWQGSFQIVLSSSDNSGGLASVLNSSPLAQFAGIAGGGINSELDTQVKILESPLVLKPIFQYVKNTKRKTGENVSNLRFQQWVKDNLDIKQGKSTLILTVTYSDDNYAIILPVLDRLSRTYQNFSGRDRTDAISRGLIYLNEQVSKLRREAEISNRQLDTFSIRYGINNKGASNANSSSDFGSLIATGPARQRQQSGGLLNSPLGTPQSSSVINQGEALAQLSSINQELIRRQQLFTDLDPSVKALVRERDALRKYIEVTAGGNLTLPGSKPFTRENSQEILLTYQKLDRTARRNNAILDSLERNLLSLQLEKARATKPWELISQPNVLDASIFPRTNLNLSLGLLGGLILGGTFAIFADKRSALIYTYSEFNHYLPCPLLASLHPMNDESWIDILALLAQGPLAGSVQVALIPVGKIEKSEAIATQLQTAIQSIDPAAQLLLSQDLTIAGRCAAQVLIAAPGAVTRNELQQLKQKLQLQGKPVVGLLWIDNAA